MITEYKLRFKESINSYRTTFDSIDASINYYKSYKGLLGVWGVNYLTYLTKKDLSLKEKAQYLAWSIYWNKRFIKEIKK